MYMQENYIRPLKTKNIDFVVGTMNENLKVVTLKKIKCNNGREFIAKLIRDLMR